MLDPNDDAILTDMLENVVQGGTGKRAALTDRAVAGKTGTTENYGDAWFVGYTPQLAVAVWVGYPKKLVPMEKQFEGGPVAGGTFPALIFKSSPRARSTHERAARVVPVAELPVGEPRAGHVPRRPVARRQRQLQFSRQVLYVIGYEPDKQADCKPNEVDVPNVVGLRVDDAQAQLAACRCGPR